MVCSTISCSLDSLLPAAPVTFLAPVSALPPLPEAASMTGEVLLPVAVAKGFGSASGADEFAPGSTGD